MDILRRLGGEVVDGADGGIATVTVSGINIDRGKPKLHVTGAKNGRLFAFAPHMHCRARDGLSGFASCVITRKHPTKHGHYRVRPLAPR
jgi:hypothetical protein